jgi:hypothetical protein
MSLLSQLLNQSPHERLGCQGLVDIKTGGSMIRAHPWFQTIDWVAVAAGREKTPHIDVVAKKMQQLYDAAQPLSLEPYEGSSACFDGF